MGLLPLNSRYSRAGTSLWVVAAIALGLGLALLFGAVLMAPFFGRSSPNAGAPGALPPNATNYTTPGGGPQPSVAPGAAGAGNQKLQDIYSQYSYLVRQSLCAQAVRLTLQDAGAIPGNPNLGSAYQYYGYLSGLSNTPGSGWSAHYASDLSQVPAGGVTVFDAVDRNGGTSTGYTHGHIMIGSDYNGSVPCGTLHWVARSSQIARWRSRSGVSWTRIRRGDQNCSS